MLIKQMAGQGPGTTAIPDDVWVSIRNSTGGALSQGYLVCFNMNLVASANGLDVMKPITSSLATFAGVVDNGTDTNYSIADTRAGLAKAKGIVNAFYRAESNGGNQIEGTRTGPITGQWFAQSTSGSYLLGPLVIASRLTALTFESRLPMYVRAL